MKKFVNVSVAAVVALGVPAAYAQGADDRVSIVREDVIDLNEWTYDRLYSDGNWTAEQLIDADVFGLNGDEIGEVENIIIGTGGQVEAIIAEVGGFWDIGDTHVRVPWSEVSVRFEEGEANVTVPVTEEIVDDYDVFGGVAGEFRVVSEDEPIIARRSWRATELVDDYVTLRAGLRYGWVEDLVFSRTGKLEAVVVDAVYGGYRRGAFAYPYYGYGYGFRPGLDYYQVPYGAEDISELGPFDYSHFGI